MTQDLQNTAINNPELFLKNNMPLNNQHKKMIKQQIDLMYKGLVLTNWAKTGTKLGTAKFKALEQLETFAKTLQGTVKTPGNNLANQHTNQNNNNAVVNEVARAVSILKKKISEQIMKSKSSEQVLSPTLAPKYKPHGEKLAQTAMQELRKMANADKQRVLVSEKQVQKFQQPQQILLLRIMAERANAA